MLHTHAASDSSLDSGRHLTKGSLSVIRALKLHLQRKGLRNCHEQYVCTATVIQQALAARPKPPAVVELLLTCRYITDARGLVVGLLGVMHNMDMSASVTAFTAVEAYVLPSHLIQVSYLPLCAVRQETPFAASTVKWHAPCCIMTETKHQGSACVGQSRPCCQGLQTWWLMARQGKPAGQHMPWQSQRWWPLGEPDRLTATPWLQDLVAEQPQLAQAAWQLLGAQVAYLTEVPALRDTSFKAVEELFR